jgi:large subunit ribosomal protein L6
MSRVGKKPIPLPAGVKVEIKDRTVKLTGPKGTLTWTHAEGVMVAHDAADKTLQVTRSSDTAQERALHGTTRALLNNMVVGVTAGYRKSLEIYGTGYGCTVSGKTLEMNVGYSLPVRMTIPDGVKVEIEVAATKGNETPAKFSVSGIDKQVVGQFARSVKDARHPEPYQGKGIRYAGEQIRRKAGKAFAGAGGT